MDEVPVLIVGGGPAGLTASLLLSRLGVASLLIDKRSTDSPLPRARGFHARAMEILRVTGVEPDLRAVELPITPGAEWRSRLDGPAMGEDVVTPAAVNDVSPCEGLSVSQDVFESVLREHAQSYAAARIQRGVKLESFTAAESGVVANLHTGQQVRARWMIAADGARSGIRDQVGIAMRGHDDLGRQQMIAFRADLSRFTGQRPRGIYFLTQTSTALIWTHPDNRWVISLPDSGGVTDEAALVREVLGVPDLELEVLAANRWMAAAQSATSYRHGSIFLVGDAAHRFPPAGATGVSTAMHDVHNLAWKIAAALAGRDLLETYAVEREPVGRRNAAETGAAWARVYTGEAPFVGRSLAQIDMGYQYRSAAVQSEDVDMDPPGADYKPTATPGCRAPHMWVKVDGRRVSTIDLFEREYVLLTGPAGSGWRSAYPAAKHVVVYEPEFLEVYGIPAEGAVLVRPDGHVASRRAGSMGGCARGADGEGPQRSGVYEMTG